MVAQNLICCGHFHYYNVINEENYTTVRGLKVVHVLMKITLYGLWIESCPYLEENYYTLRSADCKLSMSSGETSEVFLRKNGVTKANLAEFPRNFKFVSLFCQVNVPVKGLNLMIFIVF